jgi:hypothetical protein
MWVPLDKVAHLDTTKGGNAERRDLRSEKENNGLEQGDRILTTKKRDTFTNLQQIISPILYYLSLYFN